MGRVQLWGASIGDAGDSIQATFDTYGEAEGAIVTWVGSDSFEQNLRVAVDGGSPPDIAITPWPDLICEFADQGVLVSLEELGFNISDLEAAHSAYLMGLGECADGNHYAVPTNVNYKSMIWYNKPAFESGGYTIPETWEDLVALSQQIADDGITPWCVGLGSRAATGWPGTDWIEDIMVRTAGVDTYNRWAKHEIGSNDPAVAAAFDTLAEIWFAEGFVLGGIDQVSAIDFEDAPDPMFRDPPSCMLHRQGSFIANFFPEGTVPGTDADFFNFPPIDTTLPPAAVGGGELAIVFNNEPHVAAFLEAYAGPDMQCIQAAPKGHGVAGIERISANANTPLDCYESDMVGNQAEAVAAALGANGFVFDASDLMDPAVGQGTFWTGMVDWTRGTPTAEVLDAVEAGWRGTEVTSETTSSSNGDLGLAQPIVQPACDGSYVVFIGASVNPDRYAEEIADYMARYSDANYLRTDLTCSSLRSSTETGDAIYAVFFGPFPTFEEACQATSRGPSGSYVKRLDNVSDPEEIPECE